MSRTPYLKKVKRENGAKPESFGRQVCIFHSHANILNYSLSRLPGNARDSDRPTLHMADNQTIKFQTYFLFFSEPITPFILQ